MEIIRPPTRFWKSIHISLSNRCIKWILLGTQKSKKIIFLFGKKNLKAQKCCITSSRSQRQSVMDPGTVAKSFGCIVQCSIHHTLLSPWCTICSWDEVIQMCSLAKWAIKGSRRLLYFQSLLCIRSSRNSGILVILPQHYLP